MPRIFAILAIITWAILLSPYPTTVFLAACTACLTYPFYLRLRRKFSPIPAISTYVVSMAVTIFVPIFLIAGLVTPQAMNGLRLFQRWRSSGWELPAEVKIQLDSILDFLYEIPELRGWITEFSNNFSDFISTIVSTLLTGAVGFAGGVLNFLWYALLFAILACLGVVYAGQIKSLINRLLQIEVSCLNRFIISIRAALQSVMLGIVLVSLIQGALCGLGYYFFKVPEPIFWGFLSAIVAPIPFIGTAFVWVPLSVVIWFTQSPSLAIGLILWGSLIVASVDNFLRPFFLATGIKAPMFVLLLSIFCGMAVFGAIGIIAGPVLVAFALQCTAESSRLFGNEIVPIAVEPPTITQMQVKKNRVLSRLKNDKKSPYYTEKKDIEE